MHSKSKTVEQYLASLPADRRESISRVLTVVRRFIPRGYEEVMNWGMVCWQIPLSRYPRTYNGYPLMLAALASQKNHSAIYLTAVYGDLKLAHWFHDEYRKSGKKLDMGKSCVRFRTADELPLELIGRTIARVGVAEYLAMYERTRALTARPRGASARVSRALTAVEVPPTIAVAAVEPTTPKRRLTKGARTGKRPAKVAVAGAASPKPIASTAASRRAPAKSRNTAARKQAAARRKRAQ